MLIHMGQGPWHFPGGPVVKAPCFHYGGHGFNPWVGNKDSTCCAVQPKKTSGRKYKRISYDLEVGKDCLSISHICWKKSTIKEKFEKIKEMNIIKINNYSSKGITKRVKI